MKPAILIIDDEKDLRSLLTKTLQLEGYLCLAASNGKEALKMVGEAEVLAALCDIKLPDFHGVDLVGALKNTSPCTEVICFTAYGNIKDGVNAIKAGAFDYLVKGDDNAKIIPVVARASEKAALNFQLAKHARVLKEKHGFQQIIGNSDKIAQALNLAKKVAPTDSTVLLTGPTGTGKEVFAQAIHYEGSRGSQIFLGINCSTFGKELLESELFGHKAGTFTGAVKDKKGLLEEANRGTLFLDEIGEMPIELQAKLLRFLETGTFIKVGETHETSVNVRIIAATNRNLTEEIDQGRFREDLYYRLAVFQIALPSLNERVEDIPGLATHFVNVLSAKLNRKIPGITPDFLKALKSHSWKGNIRELRNVIERALILLDGDTLVSDFLPIDFNLSPLEKTSSGAVSLREMEKAHIRRVLDFMNGNKSKAAEMLGIGLTTLYRKLEEYGIQ